jgi:GNAT superfamily N-acetyltransferase
MIKELPLDPTLYGLQDLFEQHFEEVYQGANPFPPKPDIEMYGKMESVGMAFGLFAYYEEIIVGYSVCFLAPNMHSRGFLTCNNDVLFVDPLFRDTPLGLRLIKETEKKAKEKGASMIVWNTPLNTSLVKILPRLGYNCIEAVHAKEI